MLFTGTESEKGKLLFSKDGIHPTDAGHAIYTEVITRCFKKMNIPDQGAPHQLTSPLHEQPWEKGKLIPIGQIEKSDGWIPVDSQHDSVYTHRGTRTARMLRGAVRCVAPGESITLSWEGTTLGFNDIPRNYPVILEALFDGTRTETLVREQREKRAFSRTQFFPELPAGLHTVKLTVKELAEGESYYIGQFTQAGPLLPKGSSPSLD